jgi:diaminopimelate decarboxylase
MLKTRSPFLTYEQVAALLSSYGSPLYVYNADSLRNTIDAITRAVSYAHTRFHFASVTNGNIALLRIFREKCWGLHANTPGDLFLGLKAGFEGKDIVYSGSNLTIAEFTAMLQAQVGILNLDSLSQLQTFLDVYRDFPAPFAPRLGFRLNLPEIVGESRIGISVAELPIAVEMAAKLGLQINGVHFYRGTGTNTTQAFTTSIAAVLAAGEKLPHWRYLDYGGGFGFAYHYAREDFDWQIFGDELTKQLTVYGKEIELIIEPGRAAIAAAGILLARVVSQKWQNNRQIVGVDSSIANITVLSVHGGHREVYAFNANGSELYQTDVCGNSTYSRDYLARSCQLPSLRLGDIIAILDVGAYGYAMASHFLHRPRPAEVLIENGEPKLIRKAENYTVLSELQVY